VAVLFVRDLRVLVPILIPAGAEQRFRHPCLALESGCRTTMVTKPFSVELAGWARLRAPILRQSRSTATRGVHNGPYNLRPGAGKLLNPIRSGGKGAKLTEKETGRYSNTSTGPGSRPRSGVTPSSAKVWATMQRVTTHTLETHVTALRPEDRAAIRPAPNLVTEPGVTARNPDGALAARRAF